MLPYHCSTNRGRTWVNNSHTPYLWKVTSSCTFILGASHVLYIYNIFLIWNHGSEKLLSFITHLNQEYPTIKFILRFQTMKYHSLTFLICIRNVMLQRRLYPKPTDKHSISLKKSVVYSQFLTVKRLFSESEHLLKAQTLVSVFYPETISPVV